MKLKSLGFFYFSFSLYLAAAEGRAKVSIWLIEHCNLDCNAEDVNGSTSLHLAARSGHKRTLQVLLKWYVLP